MSNTGNVLATDNFKMKIHVDFRVMSVFGGP